MGLSPLVPGVSLISLYAMLWKIEFSRWCLPKKFWVGGVTFQKSGHLWERHMGSLEAICNGVLEPADVSDALATG